MGLEKAHFDLLISPKEFDEAAAHKGEVITGYAENALK